MIEQNPWQRLASLKVRQKIGLGYAIALGVAVSGTIAGFSIGNHYQQQAAKQEAHTRNEVELLHRLQSRILQTRTHQQQLIPLAESPEKFQQEHAHLLKHEAEIQQVWAELKDFVARSASSNQANQTAIPAFIQTYNGVPQNYIQELADRVERVRQLDLASPRDVKQAQALLLEFTNSDLALQFDGISDDLVGLIDQSYQEFEVAKGLSEQANEIAQRIVATSIGLSVVVAALLAFLTSQVITQPIEALTLVAKRVTKESNFDLQATVVQNDEIGMLADAFNQLIRTVQQLLEVQERTHIQMAQSEKMSALGKTVAGVAHEINNPVNFIHGNIAHLEDYSQILLDFVQLYQKHYPDPAAEIQAEAAALDIEFVQADLPKLLDSMKLGTNRIRQIVLSLRNFSRLDEAEIKAVDLHEGLDSALLILQHRLKERPNYAAIQVIRDYGSLPLVECYPGPMNQVFMNILANAIDALEEANSERAEQHQDTSSQITIRTGLMDANWVKIAISDTGVGMPEAVRHRIFDPFFTTKAVGKGTGMGLSISYQIVTEKHGGKLDCFSTPDAGTEFVIQIPIQQASAAL